MRFRMCIALLMLSGLLVKPVSAGTERDKLQDYFNTMAAKVHATADPSAKRAILSQNLSQLSGAIGTLRESRLLSANDRRSLEPLRRSVQEKQDELNGLRGFAKIADKDLDSFASYTVQDFEQADQYVTISVVTLLLIIILVVLLVRG